MKWKLYKEKGLIKNHFFSEKNDEKVLQILIFIGIYQKS